MKIYFTYNSDSREGFESKLPMITCHLPAESIEEIQGENILEKIPDLVQFIDECYRLLPKGGKATFSSPYYASSRAWISPITVRGISEHTLAFADKAWRETNKYTERTILADFEVTGSFAIEDECMQRSEDARRFWMSRYLNVAQCVLFTLTKR